MNIGGMILAALVVGLIGLTIGVLLGIAGEKFKVAVDQKEVEVRAALPGSNCGACGYPGCDGLAMAIAQGNADVNACPVGGNKVAEQIAKIMGVVSSEKEKKVAFVKCKGTCDKVKVKANYYGVKDCQQAAVVPGKGEKECQYGCMGYGSCVKACAFDAIHVIDGVAIVDKEKCVACGKCVPVCPNDLIELVPDKAKHLVQCNSKDKGKDVKAICQVGCIACTLCVKVCEFDAIHVVDNIAHIDYDKCTNCGKCAEKCPVQVIV